MTSEPTKVDYKSTLCLPQTGFPMRANLPQREPEILSRWESEGLKGKIAQKAAPKGDFILHDGPPYANGHLHVGHALNKILKDIIVRQRTMLGYHSPFVPGWDCHGLPIEQKVGAELGRKKAEMSALEIRRHCDAYARKWVDVQRGEFIRMGIGGEWDKPYLTLDPQVEVGILRALADLVRGGYVYKGLKPVFWCANCSTALADAEVEYDQHTSPSIYVKFPLLEPEKVAALADLKRPSIIIWTTTPWTLPANLAVSLHPDFEYVALRVSGPNGDEDYIVARDLAETFKTATDLPDAQVVKMGIASRDLENLLMAHPVQPDWTSRIILGEHVTLEAGTGAVHTAPGHGMDDFLVGKKYGLDPVVPVDAQGRFTNEFGLMEGMAVWEANGPIIRYLDEKDLLVKHAPYEHSYPHCWRCHNPILYRATEQWFMNVDHDDLRQRTLGVIDSAVEWIPSWGRDRIYNMMAARPDWCLSRQRVWGVPIPAVQCKGCGKATLSAEVIDKVTGIVAERGTDAWYEDDAAAFLPDGYQCPECGAAEFEKEQNILDVWFDSGTTHISVLEQRPELHRPADMYLEGSDQHRGWFHTSLLASMGARGEAPYRSVLTHGFVLDGKGEAMSKSKGNVIAPQEIIKKSGADVLRLWVASEDYRGDVKVSNEILDRVAESYRRIRNTIRYLLGNLSDFDPATDTVSLEELPEIDRWILHELHELVTNVRKAYDTYEFHKINQWVNQFCVVQISSLYVDVAKDRVYCSGGKSPGRRAAQTVQYEMAQALIRLMAPILVFTADEAYSSLVPEAGSVHLAGLPEAPGEWRRPELAAEWKQLLEVRADVMRALEDARQVKKAIGQSLEARVVVQTKAAGLTSLLKSKESLLPELFITSQARVAGEGEQVETDSDMITRLEGDHGTVQVYPARGAKCERCWRIEPSVGADAEHKGLCDRCAEVVRTYY